MPLSQTSDATSPTPGSPKPTDETIRETLESIIIAFALAFVFRAYVVEAFVIPTGSMAPTLLGQHLHTDCTQCGYGFASDASDQVTAQKDTFLNCPMCFFPNPTAAATRTRAGDRILVQKYLYSVAEPQRWDIAVFKNPRYQPPGPRQNYIKRLVGLPGEQLALLDGNLYTRASDDQPWRIARKTDPATNSRWERVQRAAWQPIYHTRYLPLDGGTGKPRMVSIGTYIDEHGERQQLFRRQTWEQPWQPQSGEWDINGRHFHMTSPDAEGSARIAFGFAKTADADLSYGGPTVRYPYDQTAFGFYTGSDYLYWSRIRNDLANPRDAIEDIRLAVTLRPDAADTSIRLRTTTRFEGEPEPVTAELSADGSVRLWVGNKAVAEGVKSPSLVPGRTMRIELWSVDQSFVVWVDGRRVLYHTYELPWDVLVNRPAASPVPEVSIEIAGGPAVILDAQLDRDLYFGSHNSDDTPARAGFWRRTQDAPAIGTPVTLAADEFFVIGDNAPISEDARYWNRYGGYPDVNPWVEATMFAENDLSHVGRVPRRLMMGRAFFVYYPAPYGLNPNASGVFPNFGKMRFIY